MHLVWHTLEYNYCRWKLIVSISLCCVIIFLILLDDNGTYIFHMWSWNFWICSKLLIFPIHRKDASEVKSYYNEDFVTQHDILRELAMHQSSQESVGQRLRLIINISGNNLPKWWTEQKQQLINARLLSISTGWHIFSLSKTPTDIHNM